MMRPDAPPGPTPTTLQNRVIYEGMEQFVTVLDSPGDDWTTATVSSVSPDIQVVASACDAALCGVVLRSVDQSRNTGQRIPAVIDGPSRNIDVVASRTSRGLLRLLTLDALTATGTSTITSSTYFASSLTGAETSVLRFTGNAPVRWFIFGSVEMGTLDVSAMGASAGPGGGQGGLAMMAASGSGGGSAASGMSGAGGGASASAGLPGAMSTVAAMPVDLACMANPFATSCGGGGGGGATGLGGGGAGALSLYALGSLRLASVVAMGADGADGGGGGGGGLVHLAGRTLTAMPMTDVSGGRGDGSGGAGGEGLARIDGVSGPAFVFETSDLLQRTESMSLRAFGAPSTMLVVERVAEGGAATQVGTAMTNASGVGTVNVTLVAGLNRLRLVQRSTPELRAMNGNHFEFARQGSDLLPVGGFLDVAYIP